MSEKEEKKKNPDNEFVNDIISRIKKLKSGEKKTSKLLYKTKLRFAPKTNVSHRAFKTRVLELKNEGKTPDEIAKLLENQALQLDIVERKVQEKKDEPVITEEEKQKLEEVKQKAEEKITEEQKAFIEKRAKGQKKVRERAKERTTDELQIALKQTEERVRKEEREIADKKIAEMKKELEELKKSEPQQQKEVKGTLPRGIETVLDVAPSVARMAGTILAPAGMGPSVGRLAQSITASGATALGNLLRSEPEQAIKEKEEKDSKDEPTVLEIGAGGYTAQAIPLGLKKFMSNIGVYASIYSRLSPEQKTMIREIDQGMLILKQALTRKPVTSAIAKTYHSAVGKVLNKMNREMDNPEDIKNNIQELASTLEGAPEEIKNVITPIDNALGVGYGQVVEMKRTGNILQPLVETARNQILELEPQQIMEAFNSVMRNATEAEQGGQERVSPRERKIPQFGLEQARQIQQIVRSNLPKTQQETLKIAGNFKEYEKHETPLSTQQRRGLEFTPEMPEFIRSGILNPPTLLAGSQQRINLPTVDAKSFPLTAPSASETLVYGPQQLREPDAKSLFRPGGMQPPRTLSTAEGDRKAKSNMEIANIEGRIKEEMAKEVERQLQEKRDLEADIKADAEEGRERVRRVGQKALEGVTAIAGIGAVNKLVPDVLKNIYSNIMETPITMPETQAQSDQKISSASGTMRPRFIVPSRDSVIPSIPKIRADDIQFSAFDYVPPGTEGGNGTARTNPLVLSQELEERLRYSNAGITISPGMGENVVSMILTESELKALLLPRGPEVSPVIYEFPIIDGDQAQNEVKRYDQNLIQVEKFSPYNEYNENYQLDEEVFGSILLSYVP